MGFRQVGVNGHCEDNHSADVDISLAHFVGCVDSMITSSVQVGALSCPKTVLMANVLSFG